MADCGLLTGCPFFNDKMFIPLSLAGKIKKKYCFREKLKYVELTNKIRDIGKYKTMVYFEER